MDKMDSVPVCQHEMVYGGSFFISLVTERPGICTLCGAECSKVTGETNHTAYNRAKDKKAAGGFDGPR